jgi:hypothetical protein
MYSNDFVWILFSSLDGQHITHNTKHAHCDVCMKYVLSLLLSKEPYQYIDFDDR